MDDEQRRRLFNALDDIAKYVHAGGEVEYKEPEPRGRKGMDRSVHRIVSFTVFEPARFDALRWRGLDARWAERDKSRQLMPPASAEQQAKIAILRAIAYRVTHPVDRYPLSWWLEQPRERTTRVTLDIDTTDLRDLIQKISRVNKAIG